MHGCDFVASMPFNPITMKPENNTLPVGYILRSPAHSYRIVSVLGRGGFGITYKVSMEGGQSGSVKYYALKEHFVADMAERMEDNSVEFASKAQKAIENSQKDFIREATMLNRIGASHPNIVHIREVFQANNTSYYIMDYLEGETLQEYIKRKGPQPIKWALRLLAPLFDALECLHDNKMTHLDIKPANIIMVEKDGIMTPVLIDFGLSKHYDADGNSTSLVQNVACSKGYAPLEQYAGLSVFTPQADVYALAATLYYVLTGSAPEIASEFSIKSLKEALPDGLPDQAVRAMMNAMRSNKDVRTKSISQFREELRRYMPVNRQMSVRKAVVPPEVPVEPEVIVTPKMVEKKSRKGIMKWVCIGAVAVAVVIAGVFFAVLPSASQRLTDAIKNKDIEVLREFAGYDSVRAFVPLAGLEIWEGDILKAADLIKRADESGMEVAGKQAMREKVREYAYYYFDEYLKEMLPKSNSAMTDEELDAAVSFRKEGDEVCRMLGYDPVAPSNWRFNELSSQAYYRWYEKGAYSSSLEERAMCYRKALDYKENRYLRAELERLEK